MRKKRRLTNRPARKACELERLVIQTKITAFIHTTKRILNLHGFDDKTVIHFLQKLQRTFLLSEDEAINQLRAILAKQLKL